MSNSPIPFVRDIKFEYGLADVLSPRIRRVVCDNPGAFTYTGTGTYLVGTNEVAVIDPGPRDEAHINAIMNALMPAEKITHILITHTHMDHSPGAAPLQKLTGAPTYGFGPHGSGSTESVEEGGDMDFTPDHVLKDGDIVQGKGWTIEAVHTPGHTSNHLCFALKEDKALFTGDHVMGWSTSIVSPPDGDMAAYMASLEKLLARDDAIYWPTHGPAITDPKPFVRSFIDHRRARDEQILQCLKDGLTRIPDMVPVMYAAVDKSLHPAAARSVLAHMQGLVDTGKVISSEGKATAAASYQLT